MQFDLYNGSKTVVVGVVVIWCLCCLCVHAGHTFGGGEPTA